MSLTKHIGIALAAIAMLATGAVASAQTTTDTTGTMQTTATTTTGTPGTPNTGAGGDATANWIILAVTGIVVIGGIIYLARSPRSQADLQ